MALKQHYSALSNVMDVDITNHNADFKSVTDKLGDEKAIIEGKIAEATKENDENYKIMDDAK
jgi:hypothetical protein